MIGKVIGGTMDANTIIQVVTIICTAIVTIVGLLVRSEVIGLKKQVKEQVAQITTLQELVTSQNTTINSLVKQLSAAKSDP